MLEVGQVWRFSSGEHLIVETIDREDQAQLVISVNCTYIGLDGLIAGCYEGSEQHFKELLAEKNAALVLKS